MRKSGRLRSFHGDFRRSPGSSVFLISVLVIVIMSGCIEDQGQASNVMDIVTVYDLGILEEIPSDSRSPYNKSVLAHHEPAREAIVSVVITSIDRETSGGPGTGCASSTDCSNVAGQNDFNGSVTHTAHYPLGPDGMVSIRYDRAVNLSISLTGEPIDADTSQECRFPSYQSFPGLWTIYPEGDQGEEFRLTGDRILVLPYVVECASRFG